MRPGRAEGNSGTAADDARIRWYPRAWRERYGAEMIDLMDEEYGSRLPPHAHRSLVFGGLVQRARSLDLLGDGMRPRDGIRSGALLVLAAWTAFVVAGADFAKFSEHFDQALPHNTRTHQAADIAFTAMQTVAGLAAIAVVGGALLATPSFVRFLRKGGWTEIRAHFLRAAAATGVAAALTAVTVLVAHRLPHHQRQVGVHWYGVLFVTWGGLVVLTLVLWTVFVAASARRVELSSAVLETEGILAAVVAVAMVVMLGASASWWAAMATYAPAFLHGTPVTASGSKWDAWWVATVALMVLATCTGVLGVVREARAWTRLQRN
jgi:hypothetical protein